MTESRYELSIRELGYQLPEVAAPVAAYVPAVVSGNYGIPPGSFHLSAVSCPLPVKSRIRVTQHS